MVWRRRNDYSEAYRLQHFSPPEKWMNDPNGMVYRYVDVLNAASQRVKYVQVEGAGHPFFDWRPDAGTRSTFMNLGVKYAADAGFL